MQDNSVSWKSKEKNYWNKKNLKTNSFSFWHSTQDGIKHGSKWQLQLSRRRLLSQTDWPQQCHFIWDLLTQVVPPQPCREAELGAWEAVGGGGVEISKILSTWELGGKIRESGSMGAWERVGKRGESKAQEPSRQRGKLDEVRFRCSCSGSGPVVEGKGTASRLPKILCSNLMLVQSRSVHRL